MTAATTTRPATGTAVEPPVEAAEARVVRLRLRRRLIWWSLPVVGILVLMAIKLIAVVVLGVQARVSFDADDAVGVELAAAGLGVANLIEPHKAYFAAGDARVLAGDFEGARSAFEGALALAPRDGVEACQIRVNLVLSLERLGDAAKTSSGVAAAKPFYDRIDAVVAEAPEGCFQPEAGNTGAELGAARERAQEKGDQPQGDQPGQQGGDAPAPPGSDKQQQLDDLTRENQQQRAQGQGNATRGAPPKADKPW